ncbi:hypothetical protein G4Y79_07850 [Phototrophicus methaneseepsis]|uniref:Peptidase C-terminal archaeal/bacterial domain-containing protein n=1 Tax=Phototrophicus methaneseepsis TaxID=2710758 RepID=A0A7S8EC62_9CHLR|nr:DUF6055 domain-containing protein [Phototrophicus methaneseepsis]QPC84275.1 hypothetical protein G4Y79_07850 [Phototrophicus methaneseepsis]
MKRYLLSCLLLGILTFGISGPGVGAQDDLVQGVQRFEGTIDSEDGVYYDVFGLRAGQTIYAYAQGLDLDTYLAVGDYDFSEILNYDDDSGNETDAAVSYEITEDGDYAIWIAGFDESEIGDYILFIGVDAPEVLTGEAEPTGDTIAERYTGDLLPEDADETEEAEQTATDQDGLVQGVQHFEGSVESEEGVYYDLYGLKAGQTIYAYALGFDEFDTYLILGDINFDEQLTFDDDSGEATDAALSYELTEDGDYSIWIAGYDEEARGDYLLMLGVDAPEVLSGNAEPTGDEIAVLYTGEAISNNPDNIALDPDIPTEPLKGVEHFEGAVEDDDGVYYDMFGLRAGQTVYIYAVGYDDFDPYVAIGDIDFNEVLAFDDDGGEGTNAALSYEIPADGDYSIWIVGYEEGNFGDYLLMLGVDAPEVMTGEAEPTGDEIAELYSVAIEVTDCSVLQERPELSGAVETYETGPFLVHYTLEGSDKTTRKVVDELVAALDSTWNYYIVQENWPEPPRDCGEGGDDRFDVYVMEILESEELLGFAQPEGLVGDNPSSELVETYAAYSYLVIDNDFNGIENGISLMRTTVAHEFMHSLQFGFDINETFGSLYESSAVWMETQVFPDDQDATPYVSDYYSLPDLCMGYEQDEFRYYSEWLLIDSLVQDYGPQIIREMWEYLATEEGLPGFYSYLEQLGTTPQEVEERLAVRNLLRRYDLASEFDAELYIEGIILEPGTVQPAATGVQQLGADYVRISQPGRYALSANDPDLNLVVVGIYDDGTADVFELGDNGVVDTNAYRYAYLILINTRAHMDLSECADIDWELTVAETADEPVASTGEVWDATQFIVSEVLIASDEDRNIDPVSVKDQRRG